MLLAAATLLLTLGGIPLLILVSGRQTYGPEGPVGAHMISGPLGILVGTGVGLAVANGSCDTAGVDRLWIYATIPGLVITLTIASIMAGVRSQGATGRLGVIASLVGSALAIHGRSLADGILPPRLGVLLIGLSALASYGMLAVMWLAHERRRSAAVHEATTRQNEFDRKQVEFQRDEWRKLPPDPALWQLIQFVHSKAPEVRVECLSRIAAMGDLDSQMQDLLGTGWAEHTLSYIARDYPTSTKALADTLSQFLTADAKKWKGRLDPGCNPQSWYFNLLPPIEAAERVDRDGGDVRAAMSAWETLLTGMPGLGDLAQRTRKLAGSSKVGS